MKQVNQPPPISASIVSSRSANQKSSSFRWVLMACGFLCTSCCAIITTRIPWIYGQSFNNYRYSIDLWGFKHGEYYTTWIDQCNALDRAFSSQDARTLCHRMLQCQSLIITALVFVSIAVLSTLAIVALGGAKSRTRVKISNYWLGITTLTGGLLVCVTEFLFLLFLTDFANDPDIIRDTFQGNNIDQLRCDWAYYIASLGGSLGILTGILYICRGFEKIQPKVLYIRQYNTRLIL